MTRLLTPKITPSELGRESEIIVKVYDEMNKKTKTIRQTARLFDVSEATLRNRLKGGITSKEAGIDRRKLTPTEEIALRNWILSLERRGLPPRREMAREMANVLLAERDKTKPPKKTYGIVDDDIYNFDETGFAMGIGATAKVIYSSDRQGKPSIIQPGNREWVTVVECVGSSGSNTPTSQALDQLLKGALITMHNAAMLTSENHKLRKAVDQLQKRHTCRTQALPNEGSLTVSEGRELAQALDQAHEAATVTNQPEPPLRAQRAPPRCSNC
uniref:HTH CENPB-type domain-containing protein n=1 Tax=Talaromyces marneffei PM1 TaxID=1077442 RepID=A0A093XEM9_TALMA